MVGLCLSFPPHTLQPRPEQQSCLGPLPFLCRPNPSQMLAKCSLLDIYRVPSRPLKVEPAALQAHPRDGETGSERRLAQGHTSNKQQLTRGLAPGQGKQTDRVISYASKPHSTVPSLTPQVGPGMSVLGSVSPSRPARGTPSTRLGAGVGLEKTLHKYLHNAKQINAVFQLTLIQRQNLFLRLLRGAGT